MLASTTRAGIWASSLGSTLWRPKDRGTGHGKRETGFGPEALCDGTKNCRDLQGQGGAACSLKSRGSALNLFKGMAGRRFRVRFAGSTVIPTDSSAVTPRIGSASSGAKITRPAVASPMNRISTRPKAYSCFVPSASSYTMVPIGCTAICRSLTAGARQSVAPVSTRKSAS